MNIVDLDLDEVFTKIAADMETTAANEKFPQPGTVIHPNLKRLSHSAETLLTSCPRKFYIDRMSKSVWDDGRTSIDTMFGEALGIGVQTWFIDKDRDAAILAMFRNWPEDIFLDRHLENRDKKNLWWAIHALDNFIMFANDELRMYELLVIDKKPAVELGFSIELIDGYTYRGKIDLVLRNIYNNSIAIMELKTTRYKEPNAAMYQNSSQGMCYSIIATRLINMLKYEKVDNLPILYTVYSTTDKSWRIMDFPKNKKSVAEWLQAKVFQANHITQYATAGMFPINGNACFMYNRPCKYIDTCQLDTAFLVGDIMFVPLKEDKPDEFPWVFTLEDVINAQLGE